MLPSMKTCTLNRHLPIASISLEKQTHCYMLNDCNRRETVHGSCSHISLVVIVWCSASPANGVAYALQLTASPVHWFSDIAALPFLQSRHRGMPTADIKKNAGKINACVHSRTHAMHIHPYFVLHLTWSIYIRFTYLPAI